MMDLTKESIAETMGKYGLPDYMVDGLYNYLVYGIKPGSFLYAVLTNDLRETFRCADSNNIQVIRNWVTFIYWELPLDTYGSPEMVEAWSKTRKEWYEQKPPSS